MGAQVGAAVPRIRRRDRSRRVWIVLVVSTLAFFAVCGLLSAGLYRYLSSITVQQPASVEVRQGVQLTRQRKGQTSQELVNKSSPIGEGDWVSTGPDTEGFLTFFGGDITAQAYFSTSVRLDMLRTTRFFQDQRSMALTLNMGTIILATADPGNYTDEHYVVNTDDGSVLIGTASKVRIEINGGPTTVVVDHGLATLLAGGKRMVVGAGQMASLDGGGEMSGPLPAEQELTHNSNFTDPPTRKADEVAHGGLGTAVWVPFIEQVAGSAPTTTTVEVVTETVGSTVVSAAVMEHEGTTEHYARAGVRQDIDQPVDFLHTIDLYATVKVVRQPLKLGGPVGNVYPLTIRVNYTDTDGKPRTWLQNFQFKDGKLDGKDPSQVQQARWTTRHFQLKTKDIGRDMAVINSIELFGYGPAFESWVTGVSLVAR